MSLQNSDELLVNRNGKSYSLQYQNLMSIQDTDLFLVNRGGKSYKVTGAELKGGFGTPPNIGQMTFTEQDPDNARFTNQKFDTAVTMSNNGDPTSTKLFDYRIKGSFKVPGTFTGTPNNISQLNTTQTWSDGLTNSTAGTAIYAFDGGTTRCQQNGAWNNANRDPIRIEFPVPLAGALQFQGGGKHSIRCVLNDKDEFEYLSENSGLGPPLVSSTGVISSATFDTYGISSGVTTGYITKIYLNGTVMVDGTPLTYGKQMDFPGGTDMTYIDAGDEFSQTGQVLDGDFTSRFTSNQGPVDLSAAFNGTETGVGAQTNATLTFEVGGRVKGLQVSTFATSSQQTTVTFYDGDSPIQTNGYTTNGTYLATLDPDKVCTKVTIYRGGGNTIVNQFYMDGEPLIQGQNFSTSLYGTAGTITGTSILVPTYNFKTGQLVTGPQDKLVPIPNITKYVQFDNQGNVSALIDSSQSPAVIFNDVNPSFTLSFPKTFADGQKPDGVIPEGSVITSIVTATGKGSDTETRNLTPVGLDMSALCSSTLWTGTGQEQFINTGIDNVNQDTFTWTKARSAANNHSMIDTIRGRYWMEPNTSQKNQPFYSYEGITSYSVNGFTVDNGAANINAGNVTYVTWNMAKYPGFMDIVPFNGKGTYPHSLGTVPGLMLVKSTASSRSWYVWWTGGGTSKYMFWNDSTNQTTNANAWGSNPTATEFSVDAIASNDAHIAYLFAANGTGIKCGQYNGDGGNQQINCGWEPQWVMIKGINNSGNWVVFDSARGENNGIQVNNAYAESVGYGQVSLNSTGFICNGAFQNTNQSNKTYIYVAIRK